MLRIDIRLLRDGPVQTDFEVSPDDPALRGFGSQLSGPVEVAGTLRPTAGQDYLWRATVRAQAVGECRRCLAPAAQIVEEGVEVVFSTNPELLEDPGVYELSGQTAEVDLGPALYEELALRIPAFPLCRPDCQGLCATCGADLNAGACGCSSGSTN